MKNRLFVFTSLTTLFAIELQAISLESLRPHVRVPRAFALLQPANTDHVTTDSTKQFAAIETESILSKKDSAYTYLQNAVAKVFRPKPIVDTIQEEDKYGNDGDKFRNVGNVIVNGAEGLSNIINKAIDFPMEKFKSITRLASSKLNILGGKLVGLER